MVGRLAKAKSRTANVYVRGGSDGCVVPTKDPNNDGSMASAEGLEGRRPTKENTEQPSSRRTQRREVVSRVRCPVYGRSRRIPPAFIDVSIRGRSRMREFRSYGSVRGAPGNRRSYRDSNKASAASYQ